MSSSATCKCGHSKSAHVIGENTYSCVHARCACVAFVQRNGRVRVVPPAEIAAHPSQSLRAADYVRIRKDLARSATVQIWLTSGQARALLTSLGMFETMLEMVTHMGGPSLDRESVRTVARVRALVTAQCAAAGVQVDLSEPVDDGE